MALVGPNNAGKSTLLRLFFELRRLLQAIKPDNALLDAIQGQGAFTAETAEVFDPVEIFCDQNDRAIELEFAFPDAAFRAAQQAIRKFTLTAARPHPQTWRIRTGPPFQPLQQPQAPLRVAGGMVSIANNSIADVRPFLDVIAPIPR